MVYSPDYEDLIYRLKEGGEHVPLQLFENAEQVKAAAQAIRANTTSSRMILIAGRTTDILTEAQAAAAENGYPDLEWEPLLDVLGHRENLKEIVILGNDHHRYRELEVPHHIVAFLRTQLFSALKRNPNVRQLVLWDDLDLANTISTTAAGESDLVDFLKGAPSLQQLSLWWCRGRDETFTRLTNALQVNKTLQTLSLAGLRDGHAGIILGGLTTSGNQSSIRELHYKPDRMELPNLQPDGSYLEPFPSIERYLRSRTCAITNLQLSDMYLSEALLRSVSANANLRTLIFKGFCSGPAVNLAHPEVGQEALAACLSSTHLLHLRIDNCHTLLAQPFVRHALCGALRRPNSSPLSLDISLHRPHGPWEPGTGELLEAFSKSSRLKCLRIKTDRTSFNVPTLVKAIPSLRVDRFTVVHELSHQAVSEKDSMDLIQAAGKNLNFKKVDVELGRVSGSLIGYKEKHLKFCEDRNAKLVKWRVRHKSVPTKLQCYALAMASRAGTDHLYRTLLAVAPVLSKHGDRVLADRREEGGIKRQRTMPGAQDG